MNILLIHYSLRSLNCNVRRRIRMLMQNESSQSPCVPKPLKNLTLGPSTCKTMLRQHRSQRFVAIISFETSLSLHRYFFSHIDFTLAPNRASSLGFTLIFAISHRYRMLVHLARSLIFSCYGGGGRTLGRHSCSNVRVPSLTPCS